MSEIPLDDIKAFDAWINAQWRAKDRLLEQFFETGRFPADDGAETRGAEDKPVRGAGCIETEVKLKSYVEIGQIFVVVAALALVANVLEKLWTGIVRGALGL